ncbi:MAG TPA: hypothetical protein VGQ57_20700, partial [Polyangiaceae bacterium]|nr:hypothetical protein [Polyangiaceae bacterium]
MIPSRSFVPVALFAWVLSCSDASKDAGAGSAGKTSNAAGGMPGSGGGFAGTSGANAGRAAATGGSGTTAGGTSAGRGAAAGPGSGGSGATTSGRGGTGGASGAPSGGGSPGAGTGGHAGTEAEGGAGAAANGGRAAGGTTGASGAPSGGASCSGPVGKLTGALATGIAFNDTDGARVNAHGGGIIRVGDTFYLHGEYFPSGGTDNDFHGFTMYSSKDLATWKSEGVILPTQASGELGPNRKGERPHIVQCPKTGEFVLYAHAASEDYQMDREVVFATSPTVNGKYAYQGPLKNSGGSVAAHSDMSAYAD